MKRVFRLDNQGVTLVELLIGITLTTLVMAAMFTFLIMNINFSNVAQDEVYIQEQVRKAMKTITEQAMNKEGYALDEFGNITLQKGTGEELEKITFKCENGSLSYIDGAGTSTVIAGNIEKFKVEEIVANELPLNVTIKGVKNKGSKKNEVSFELTSKVFLRNYKEPEEP
ncbi:MAG: prepilin-type N-terminal cleavage/methylation domain-containing protein [Clostridia bacterium]|nr:prepilin-type N-terminal cleavage/methylation domain-containing protein [Clostridia bacterium]